MKTILTFFLICLLLSNIYAQKPVADFEFEAKNYYCTTISLRVINKSTNADSCFWDFTNQGNFDYYKNNTINLGNFGIDQNFVVTLIAVKNGMADTIKKSYYLKQMSVNFKYDILDDTLVSDSVKFQFISNVVERDGITLTYNWNFGDTTYSREINPIHSFLKKGTRLVRLTVADSIGCEYTFEKYVHLKKDSTHPHIPFPTKNAMWTEMYYNPWPDESAKFHCFALKNSDTIINGNLYHKLYHSEDTIFTEDKLCGGIREENGVIYYYSINTLPYNLMEMQNNTEVKLFNSNFELGDTLRLQDKYLVDFDMVIKDTYDLSLNNSVRRCYQLSFSFYTWIEGIGTTMGLLFGFGLIPSDGVWNDLICFKQNDTIVYHNNQYASCYYTNTLIKGTKVQNQVIIKPNPVVDNAEITFAPDYKKLEIISPLGQVVKNINVTGATSVRLNNNEIPPGIYMVLLIDKQGNKTTAKLVIE